MEKRVEIKENTVIHKILYSTEVKEVEGKLRTLRVVISTSDTDRSKDIMLPQGALIENYLKNPVVSAFHNYHEPSIARCVSLVFEERRIIAELEFTPEGMNPKADQLFNQYKAGFMFAWSIGFLPKRWEDHADDFGRTYIEWELLEFAAVLVPDNPEALTLLRSKGIDIDELMKHFDNPEFKEGRVLSEKNRQVVNDTITQLEGLTGLLKELLAASEKPTSDDGKQVDIETLTDVDPTREFEEAILQIRGFLRYGDKSIGLSLKKINEYLDQLGDSKGGDING